METEYTEYDYFTLRKLNKIYVSKEFPFFSYKGVFTKQKRFIKKVFEKKEDNEFVKVRGEIVLRSSALGRDQVNVLVYSDEENRVMNFTLQKFRQNRDSLTPYKETSFTFRQDEFLALLKFLSDLKFIDFSDKTRFVIEDSKFSFRKILLNLKPPERDKVLVDKSDAEIIKFLAHLKGDDRKKLLTSLKNKILTKEDLDILSGRKEGLSEFDKQLLKEKDWDEKEWQEFFKNNTWILGYGLDYKFLSIIQKEAKVSNVDLDGKNTVITDFLLSDNRFTVLVELKRPDTPLFEADINRSRTWKLSKDLTYAVSQILTQKAEWEIKSQSEQYDTEGNLIQAQTHDPKTILIIGSTTQFKGTDRESKVKSKTFELYRRNSRNIEILTFDELFEKARFIVNSNSDNSTKDVDYDDLPF